MPTSKDPILRQRQLANLSRNGRPPSHGLTSKRVMAPYREQALAWARDRWPWLDETRLRLAARWAAQVDRVDDWSQTQDILIGRSARTTRFQPAVVESNKVQAQLLALMRELDAEARERDRDGAPTLADVVAEIEANRAGADPQ